MRSDDKWMCFLALALAMILTTIVAAVWLSQPSATTTNGADLPSIWRDTVPNWLTALFAGASAAVSLAAVIYVKRTLAATWEAVEAAKKGVVETRRLGEAQTRAYLHIAEAKYQLRGRNAEIHLRIGNGSPTPAMGVKVNWTLSLELAPVGDYHRVEVLPDVNVSQAVAAHQKETFAAVWNLHLFEADAAHVLRERPDKIRLHVSIEWTDVFERRQRVIYLVHGDFHSLKGPEVASPLVIQMAHYVDIH